MEREHFLTGHYSLRGILHDWEKPFLYLCPWLKSGDEVQKRHRVFSPHHDGCAKTSKIEHLIEMYIDWDCAPITKPDKPLNAFETLVHFYPHLIPSMLPVCLAMDPNNVKRSIYLHSWHDLSSNPAYNRKVYAKVLFVLKQIIASLPEHENFFEEALQNYLYQDITVKSYGPTTIFVLALCKQHKNLNSALSLSRIKEVLEDKLAEFQRADCFIALAPGILLHDYRKIKPSPYFVGSS